MEQTGSTKGATFERRRAVVAAAILSSLGVIALAIRESRPHPGRIAAPELLLVGLLVYIAPLAFVVDRAIRRGTTRLAAVVLVGAGGVIFLATRPVGSFSQVWPVFTMIVSLVVLQVVSQLIRAGLMPALRQPGWQRR